MNYPFDTVGLNGQTIDAFDDTYKLLRSKFNIEPTGNIDFHLPDFEVFRQYQDVDLRGSYAFKQPGNDSYMLFVETQARVAPMKDRIYERYEYQTWALAYLKKDFGRALIRPETLGDKLLELIHPIELDFVEDKAFSDTFYVLVNDRRKAEAAMDRYFRNAIMDIRHEDVLVEIIGHTLIIGNRQPISPERSRLLAEFVVRLSSNC